MSDRLPFEGGVEYDRVTLAYWHQADPALSPKIRTLTQGLIDRVPNPVPDGQSVRQYCDATYPISVNRSSLFCRAGDTCSHERETCTVAGPGLARTLMVEKHTRIWGPRKAASHQPLPLSRIAFASIDPEVDECIGLFSPNELC